MSIDEARREAIINKLKELEEFLEPEGAHFVLPHRSRKPLALDTGMKAAQRYKRSG